MPSGPKKRRAVRNKKATLGVVLQEPKDHMEVQPILDSYIAEEIKQENLGNLNSCNQEDGSLFRNDFGSAILPALSVRNEKPSKQETIILSESALMVAADHEKPVEVVCASEEVLASPITDESQQMITDDSDPITGTDLNALPSKGCKTEAKEVLPKSAISSDERDKTIPLLLTIKARNDNLKECLEAAVLLSDKLNDAVEELLRIAPLHLEKLSRIAPLQ